MYISGSKKVFKDVIRTFKDVIRPSVMVKTIQHIKAAMDDKMTSINLDYFEEEMRKLIDLTLSLYSSGKDKPDRHDQGTVGIS